MLVPFLLLISPRKKLDIYHRSLLQYLLFLSLFLFVSLNYLSLFSFFFFADSVCDTSGLYHIQLKK